jgi:phage tail sheath gpL-like
VEGAAALAAQTAISVRADQAQPIRDVFLADVLAPPVSSRFSLSQRNTLLFDGISTFNVDNAGNVILEKLITTYQFNTFRGRRTTATWTPRRCSTWPASCASLKTLVTSKYGRVKLAANGTFLHPRLRRRDAEHHPRRHHRPLPGDGGGRPGAAVGRSSPRAWSCS